MAMENLWFFYSWWEYILWQSVLVALLSSTFNNNNNNHKSCEDARDVNGWFLSTTLDRHFRFIVQWYWVSGTPMLITTYQFARRIDSLPNSVHHSFRYSCRCIPALSQRPHAANTVLHSMANDPTQSVLKYTKLQFYWFMAILSKNYSVSNQINVCGPHFPVAHDGLGIHVNCLVYSQNQLEHKGCWCGPMVPCAT